MSDLLPIIPLFGDDIPWLAGRRARGREVFCLPTAKTEAWKYTKLHTLQRDDLVYQPSKFLEELEGVAETERNCSCHHQDSNCSCGEHCQCSHKPNLYIDLPFDAYQLHFYNGKFIPLYPALPLGVEVITLMQAIVEGQAKNYVGKYVDLTKHPFAALNSAMLEEGLFINIDSDVHLPKPLIIVYHNDSPQPLVNNICNIIIAGKSSSAEIVEYYYHSGNEKDFYFNNIVNEFYLSNQANIKHYKFQNESFKSAHIALNYVRVREDAFYKSFCLQKGADLSRNETKIDLLQEKARAQVDAAYIMNGWATIDTTTDINHLSEKTSSNQLIKGVVGGEARGVFQGKISIAKDAQETEGFQMHRALLLSDTAEIDAKPELEIFADNVKCSHGSASGELDQEQLFYMRSRGIGEEEAKQILINAYLLEVINHIDNEEIKEWIRSHV